MRGIASLMATQQLPPRPCFFAKPYHELEPAKGVRMPHPLRRVSAEGGNQPRLRPIAAALNRREMVASSLCGLALLDASQQHSAQGKNETLDGPPTYAELAPSTGSAYVGGPAEWFSAGPMTPARLPRLEHTCSDLFPRCIGNQCLLRIDVVYPTGSALPPPYPLAIITGGFLVPSAKYESYAERLASWGYVCLLYDKVESAMDSLTDTVSLAFLRELVDWAEADPLLTRLADVTQGVYLVGHSRGAKLSVLAAAQDTRVSAVCLLDPVDNTKYAPLGLEYPSAIAALRELGIEGSDRAGVPLALVGSGRGGDCAPRGANYTNFYDACSAPALEMVLRDAGHFQFLDEQSALDRAVCAVGRTPDQAIRSTSQAIMVAWGQLIIRERQHESGSSHINQARAADRLKEFEKQLARLSTDAEPGGPGALAGPPFLFRSKGLEDIISG